MTDDEREAQIRQTARDIISVSDVGFLYHQLGEARAEIAKLTEQNDYFKGEYQDELGLSGLREQLAGVAAERDRLLVSEAAWMRRATTTMNPIQEATVLIPPDDETTRILGRPSQFERGREYGLRQGVPSADAMARAKKTTSYWYVGLRCDHPMVLKDITHAIEQAVAAERERAARIADRYADNPVSCDGNNTREAQGMDHRSGAVDSAIAIAVAIRADENGAVEAPYHPSDPSGW